MERKKHKIILCFRLSTFFLNSSNYVGLMLKPSNFVKFVYNIFFPFLICQQLPPGHSLGNTRLLIYLPLV